MGFINEYPNTDFHELNLDWIIKTIIELQNRVNNIKTEFLSEANEYTDEQISDKIGTIQRDVISFKIDVNNSFNNTDLCLNSIFTSSKTISIFIHLLFFLLFLSFVTISKCLNLTFEMLF